MKGSLQQSFSKIPLGLAHYIYIFLVLVCSVIGVFLPLVNNIGYESSMWGAIILSLFGGLSTTSFLRSGASISSTKELRKRTWPYFISLFFLTVAVPVSYTVLTGGCLYWEGLLFYLVITLPSLFIGIKKATIIRNLKYNKFAPL